MIENKTPLPTTKLFLNRTTKNVGKLNENIKRLDYLIVLDSLNKFTENFENSKTLLDGACRSAGDTLSRGQFHKRLRAVTTSLYPSRNQYLEDNEGAVITDPLLRELAPGVTEEEVRAKTEPDLGVDLS